MAQSLMIIEPVRAFICTGTCAKNHKTVATGSGVRSDDPTPNSHSSARDIGPNTRDIERRASRDRRREHELARANDFYAAMLAMATHDLRQPLQVIAGCHELLAEELLAGRKGRYLERAKRASRELAAKLDQLTDVLRIQQQSGSIRKEPVHLDPLFQRIAAQFAEPAREKRVDLRFRSTAVTIVSSPMMLDGIVGNLVRNALEHTATGGRILVGCRRRGSEIRIEVHDNGAGIAQHQLRQVFEPFARLDMALPAGLGLGLFIVKRAADYLGHRIEVSSALGQGCCFAVAAPAVE